MPTLFQKIRLLEGLIGGEKAYTGPFHAMVDVTRRCNLRCIGCRFHSLETRKPSVGDQSVSDISIDVFQKICSELKAAGTRTLFLLGEGEPFLYEHIFELIAIAKKSGFHVTVITNGTLLNREKVELLLDSRLDILQVSLWASSSADYNLQYHGSDPKNFERVINGLNLIRSLKSARKRVFPKVILHNPINRLNYKNVGVMAELALAVGCEAISFSPFLSTKGGPSPYVLGVNEKIALLQELKKLQNHLRIKRLKHNIPLVLLRYEVTEHKRWPLPCYIGWFHARFRVDGSMAPCGFCDILFGNIREKSFNEIWNSPLYRGFRRQCMTRNGLLSLTQQCDCEHCCYAYDNMRTHRFFKWIAPFVLPSKEKHQ